MMNLPSIPPRAGGSGPLTPFQQWMERQVQIGHKRKWLTANLPALRERFNNAADMGLPMHDLPLPHEPAPAFKDRYSEL